MPLRSTSESPDQVIDKILFFVQLGDLHVRVYFGVVGNLTLPLLVGASSIARFVKAIFLIECRIFPILSRPVASISKCTPVWDPPAAIQADSDVEISTED